MDLCDIAERRDGPRVVERNAQGGCNFRGCDLPCPLFPFVYSLCPYMVLDVRADKQTEVLAPGLDSELGPVRDVLAEENPDFPNDLVGER